MHTYHILKKYRYVGSFIDHIWRWAATVQHKMLRSTEKGEWNEICSMIVFEQNALLKITTVFIGLKNSQVISFPSAIKLPDGAAETLFSLAQFRKT